MRFIVKKDGGNGIYLPPNEVEKQYIELEQIDTAVQKK